MPRPIIAAALVTVLVAGGAAAQQPTGDRPAAARDQDATDAFAEMLRRTDPAAHARFVRLRQARDASLEELRRAHERYQRAGPELRAVSLPQLREARRKYATDHLAFLDFLDERDRVALEEYRGAMERIGRVMAERARSREEIKELLAE